MTRTFKLGHAYVVTVGPSNSYGKLVGRVQVGRLTAFFLTRYVTVVRIKG